MAAVFRCSRCASPVVEFKGLSGQRLQGPDHAAGFDGFGSRARVSNRL
jgi:hypothetical protein